MTRKIIHLDLDAFFCAVEELLDPSLKGKAFAVGGSPTGRGVVTSASYAARRYGIRSAMPMARAVRLYSQLVIVRSHRDEYRKKSREVMQILRETTEMVEQLSIDEAFLDVSHRADTPGNVARELQAKIRSETKMPCSLGVASNKLVAKIATDFGKSRKKTGDYPNAVQVVPPGEEAAFLAPLPVGALWGVGPKTAQRLEEIGMRTIGDIARWPLQDLERRFGQHGRDLARRAQGIDSGVVHTTRETKSISQEVTFFEDVNDREKLYRTMRRHSENIAESLVRSSLTAATVKLKLRWPDFTTITRQTTLPKPTTDAGIIYKTAETLLNDNWNGFSPIRLLGVGVSGLQPPAKQLSLWELEMEQAGRNDNAFKP
jgi:DNA polymerase-4